MSVVEIILSLVVAALIITVICMGYKIREAEKNYSKINERLEKIIDTLQKLQ